MAKEKIYPNNVVNKVIIKTKQTSKFNNLNNNKQFKKSVETKSRIAKLNDLINTVLADFEKYKIEEHNKIDNVFIRGLAKNPITGLISPANFDLKRHYFNKGRGSKLKHQIYQLVENIRVIEKRDDMPYVKKQLPGFF